MKRIIIILSMLCGVAYGQCPDPDTVTNNTVTLITATTARVNGTQATPTANQTIVLRYVRSGFTDTVSATGSGVMRNLTGLSPSTLYKYYYRTLCSDGRTDNQASYYTFTTLTSTVQYVAERPTVFQYLKTDTGGIAFVPSDTLEWRTPTDLAIIKYKSSNSTFYGYYPSCLCWRPLATDSAGIIAQLDLKVDSVTVSGDSLFWWNNHGVSHGYILPALNNVWKLQGNLATDTSADFLGTTDALPVKFKINSLNAGMIGFNSTSLGYGALPPNATTGGTGIGVGALANNTGVNNTAVGEGAASANTTGTYNVGLGYRSLYGNLTGLGNTALGAQSLYTATNGLNTAIGKDALYSSTTGSANVALGYAAGKYNTTLANRLYINGVDQSNLAGDTTVSLVYGTFSSTNTYTAQRFKINGRLEVRDGTQSNGYIAVSDANGRSTWTNPTSIVTATPTLQQAITAGAVLTGNNTIDGGGYDFRLDNTSSSYIDAVNGSNILHASSGTDEGTVTVNSGVEISSQKTGSLKISSVQVLPDSILIRPYLGQINIDSLRSTSSMTRKNVMVWDTVGGGWYEIPASLLGLGTVTGTGTANNMTKWTSSTAIGNALMTDDGSIVTNSGRTVLSVNGAVSAPGLTATGTWFTGGSATTTKPQFLIEPTGTTSTAWSTAGTGLGVNAASGFTGNLIDAQLAGVSKYLVKSTGEANFKEKISVGGGAHQTVIRSDAILLGGGSSSTFVIYGDQGAYTPTIEINPSAVGSGLANSVVINSGKFGVGATPDSLLTVNTSARIGTNLKVGNNATIGGTLSVTGTTTLNGAIAAADGANKSVGVSAAMTAGTITISNTRVTANSRIFLTHATLGGVQGILSVGTITAGTSFVINSSSAADTGTVNWFIIN